MTWHFMPVPNRASKEMGQARRFMGSENWGYESPDMGYKYSYPTYTVDFIVIFSKLSDERHISM